MLRVFVSSTFNDMHRERDCLEDIQQDLNAIIFEYGEKVEFIDLRWGISTEELDEDGKNAAVLEGCFSAIDKSDYLLVFLGNRYGTIKSYDEVLGYLGRKKTNILFKGEASGKSVTELEVTYAQLIKGFDSRNTLVCIRDEQNIEKKAQKFIDRFENNKSYENSVIHYNTDDSVNFRTKLKNQLVKIVEEHLDQGTVFDRDRKRLKNLAVDAILNEQMSSFVINNQMVILSGESGIGKSTAVAEILGRNYREKLIPFVTWEAKERRLTFQQVLDALADRFSEWFNETPDKNDIQGYLKKCSSRIADSGFEFVIFLDSVDNISGIRYRELLDILAGGHLFISTHNYRDILSAIPSFQDYKVFEEADILFKPNEVANVIKNEFDEHGKKVSDETIDILVRKKDIVKPLYLHFAIKRLLFLKGYDFEMCAPGESPEVKVLSEIANDFPDDLNELLIYCIKNIVENSDISSQMKMIIELISESYKGVTEEVIIDYLIIKKVGNNRAEILPYVYEIRNRLEEFLTTDGMWYNPRFDKVVYSWNNEGGDIGQFVENRKKDYKNEYFARQYLYRNCRNDAKIISFLSTRALWKFENSSVRAMYRDIFWGLVEEGYIREEVLDERLFMDLFEMYRRNTDRYYTGLICTKNSVFKLLSEKIEEEKRNYLNGDSITFLLRIAEVYINELIWLNYSCILIQIDEIPFEVLDVFEKLSFVLKAFAKALLSTHYSEWNLEKIYESLTDDVVEYSDIINSLYCAEMLVDSEDSRSVTYYHNAIRLLSATDFLVNLGKYDDRYATDKKIGYNGLYFNWRFNSGKVFDTVKYLLLYMLSEWVDSFSTDGNQDAMDIVAIDYYLSYSKRIDYVTVYNDALILLLVTLYEVYKLSYFRKYKDYIEDYWIKNYPYTGLKFCSKPEDVSGDDYEIRGTVFRTIEELNRALDNAYSREDIGLKEKCTLDILRRRVFEMIRKIPHMNKSKIIRSLEVLNDEPVFLETVRENKDLYDYYPTAYDLDNDKEVIRQALKELNLNCI